MARTKTSKRKTPATSKISTPAQKKQIPSNLSRPMASGSDVEDGESVEAVSHNLSTPTVSLEDISMPKTRPKPTATSTPTSSHMSCQTIRRSWRHRKVRGNLLMGPPHHKKPLSTSVGDGASPTPLQMTKSLSCLSGIRCIHSSMTSVKSTTKTVLRRMACWRIGGWRWILHAAVSIVMFSKPF